MEPFSLNLNPLRMKNLFYLLCIGLICFNSCSTKSIEVENDLKKGNLKGDVVFIHNLSNLDPSLEFNEDGMILRKIYFDPKYSIYQEWIYSYLGNKVIKDVEFLDGQNKGLVSYTGNYTYDSDDQLIRYDQNRDGNEEKVEYYFIDGLLSEKIESNNIYNKSIKYYYNSDKLDSTIQIDTESKTKIVKGKVVNYFDDKGKIIESNYTYRDGSKNRQVNIYDEETGLLKEYIYGGKKNEYKYDYDSKDNWIKLYINGNLIQERKIYYKGDDYSKIINEVDNFKKSLQSNSSNSSYRNSSNNSSSKPKSKNKVCYNCKGAGELICYTCNGSAIQNCPNHRGPDCYTCKGSGVTKCYSCIGGKTRCRICSGTGIDNRF